MNCPRSKGNTSAPTPAATVINPPILFVTVINWSIHNMLLAYIGAIPIPINAVKMPNASTVLSANIARRVHPTILIKKLNKRVPKGLNFTEMKIAMNLIAANDPQNTAVIFAPFCLDRCSFDCTEKVFFCSITGEFENI